MNIYTTNYSKTALALGLFLALSTEAAFASNQSVNTTPDSKSNHNFLSAIPSSFNLKHGHTIVQLGYYWSAQGKNQDININSLVGNQYVDANVNNHSPSNGLFGIGYFVDGLEKDRFQLSYGINAFYLAGTPVTGSIVQEHSFTNLSYSYDIQHIPLYFAAKAKVKTNSEKYNITFDAGIGPNFMRTSQYNETPLTTYTIPDNAFAAHNNVAFTATAGVGLRLNDIFGRSPLECGYRFFYLGQGQLAMNNDQLLNTIKTGNTFGNAIVCSVTV